MSRLRNARNITEKGGDMFNLVGEWSELWMDIADRTGRSYEYDHELERIEGIRTRSKKAINK